MSEAPSERYTPREAPSEQPGPREAPSERPGAPGNKSLLQPVDDKARAQARRLIRGARFAAIAVAEPGSGHPAVSRTAIATDIDGAPTMLMSGLAAHTAALLADPRCALLLGEPGRGDPLAHPRISVSGRARRLERDDPVGVRVRRRYLARLPKAALYADFGDFAFWRVEPERASLNGGFGRAFALTPADLLSTLADAATFAQAEAALVEQLNAGRAADLARLAAALGGDPGQPWQAASIDPDGLDLVCGDDLRRAAFDAPAGDAEALAAAIAATLAAAPPP